MPRSFYRDGIFQEKLQKLTTQKKVEEYHVEKIIFWDCVMKQI